jgi:hypothetical protein
MDWIKRNLVFVIGAAVTLVLMAMAGWYSYSGWSNNATQREEITKAYEELNSLYASKPAPGDGKKVDNIKLAKEQQQEAQEFIQKLAGQLLPIPSIPPMPAGATNIASRDYSAALQEAIAQLQKEAANSSVILPPKYKFSFEKQASLVTFAPGTVEPLAVQLGEVKAICDVLNQAKVNSLDGIRRERIAGSPDDMTGPATDYLNTPAITNELAILTPYEISFRSFSPELAGVLAGFAQSRYGFIVKAVNVEPAAATATDPAAVTPAYAQPVYAPPVAGARVLAEEGGGPAAAMRARYGVPGANPYGAYPPVAQPAPVAAAPVKSGLQILLKEKQLKVTLLVHVVKLLPPQK